MSVDYNTVTAYKNKLNHSSTGYSLQIQKNHSQYWFSFPITGLDLSSRHRRSYEGLNIAEKLIYSVCYFMSALLWFTSLFLALKKFTGICLNLISCTNQYKTNLLEISYPSLYKSYSRLSFHFLIFTSCDI